MENTDKEMKPLTKEELELIEKLLMSLDPESKLFAEPKKHVRELINKKNQINNQN